MATLGTADAGHSHLNEEIRIEQSLKKEEGIIFKRETLNGREFLNGHEKR